MFRILCVLFYRSFRDFILWLLLLLTFLLFVLFWNAMNIRSIGVLEEQIEQSSLRAVAGAYAWEGEKDTPDAEKEAFFAYYVSYSAARMLREANPVRLLSISAAAYLIGTLFTRRTVQAMLFRGYSRGEILCAALVHYGFVLVFTLAASVIGYMLLKFGGRAAALFAAPRFWGNLGLWLLLSLSALMPQFACAFWIRNLFGTLLASFLLMLVQVFIPTGTFCGAVFAGPIGDYLPFGILEKESLWQSGGALDAGKQLLLYAIPLGIILLSAFAAYFGFRKSALR